MDSILPQLGSQVEVVIADGISTDETFAYLQQVAAENPHLRYVRMQTDSGIDEGYDVAVTAAHGSYCWLMPDDDVIVEGGIARVLQEIAQGYDVILVDIDCCTKDLGQSLQQTLYNAAQDTVFDGMTDAFLAQCGKGLSYIGSVVVRRAIWFEAERQPYYGSYFAHVAVLLESASLQRILLMHEPYLRYRSGNSSWTARSFEIWNFKWPALVWDIGKLTPQGKALVTPREPWRRVLSILKSRALGEYDVTIFRRLLAPHLSGITYMVYALIAVLPKTGVNSLLLLHCLLFRRGAPYTIYNFILTHRYQRLAVKLAMRFGLTFPPDAFTYVPGVPALPC